MVMSACMMLDFIDEFELAKKIRKAVEEVVADGKVKSYDMMKMPGRQDVINKGAATTTEMANAIIAKL